MEALWRYGALLEPDASMRGAIRVRISSASPTTLATEALVEMFLCEPDLFRVALEVDGELIGVATRDRIRQLHDRAGAPSRSSGGPPGDGDGASLPGRSSAFVVFRYQCATCGAEVRVLFVDGPVPRCPEGHGDLEPVR